MACFSAACAVSPQGKTHVLASTSSTGDWKPEYWLRPLQHRSMEGKKVVIDSKLEVVLPHGVVLKEDEESTREKIMPKVWMSCVKDEFGWAHLIQTKRDFSYAIAEPWTGLWRLG